MPYIHLHVLVCRMAAISKHALYTLVYFGTPTHACSARCELTAKYLYTPTCKHVDMLHT